MAENNQDMAVEDILSSIKNILEEDAQNHSAQGDGQAQPSDVVDDVINTTPKVDDILELSPDMRIEEEEPVKDELSHLEDADPVASVVGDKADDSAIAMGINGIDSNPSLTPSDADLVTEGPSDVLPSELSELDIGVEDLGDDAAIEEQNALTDQVSEDVPADNLATMPESAYHQDTGDFAPAEEVIETEPQFAETIVDTMVTAPEPGNTKPLSEVSAAVVSEISQDDGNIAETKEEVSSSVQENAAVDASANIISNFAKMFSHPTPTEPVKVAQPEPEIVAAGNESKTLEEFVVDSITKVIGHEVAKQWNHGAEFETFAKEEIIRQTKTWLNGNLPQLVENVVKQEIERVIAKVGS